MAPHWTERNIKDYVFRIGADFVTQLEERMEVEKVSQQRLARKLDKSEGRISQLFNRPGNITLANVVRYTRALGLKVSIVAYDDNDPENKKGPVNSAVFRICWERCGKPHDFWDVQHIQNGATATYIIPNAGQTFLTNVAAGVTIGGVGLIHTFQGAITINETGQAHQYGAMLNTWVANSASPIPDTVQDAAVQG